MKLFGRIAGCGAVLLAWLVPARCQEALRDAVARSEAGIAQVRTELATVYAEIAAEKAERMRAADAAEAQCRTLEEQRQATAAQTEEDTAEAERALAAVRHLDEVQRFVADLCAEYRGAFEGRLGAAEASAYAADLEALDASLGAKPDAVDPAALTALLRLGLDRCFGAVGGRSFEGEALDTSGLVIPGRYETFGPIAFFAPGDGGAPGLAVQETGSLLPTVFTGFDPAETAALRALFAEGRGTVPVDVTMGSGVRLHQTRDTLAQHLRKGGIIMVPLLALGSVCALIVLVKLVSVTTLATGRAQAQVMEIVADLRAGDAAAAEAKARRLRRPVRGVILEGLAHRTASKEHLEEILYEQVLSQVPGLERFLSPLAVCASAAPLLGLLGTVTGMIHTFRLITVFGTGDARLLSAGISEALITTEVGLAIAIPALLFHAYLSRRVRRIVGTVQEVALTFVNGIKLKGGNGG
ncbi:MAG: MotA/TolQ/ExbB proton channel family protein [Lentisphaeria bacterium]|nr:MotA/TolQ/ExbB proton channel family protein [Lentisphaeria bacterium]